MHRHQVMYNGIYGSYPHHHHHHGMTMCSPYEIMEPLPMTSCPPPPPPYMYDYPYRRSGILPYIDYPYYDYAPRVLPRPPMVQTNVHNDVCYYLDEPYNTYDDEYGNPHRMSHSKVQLVDLVPKTRPARNNNRMVVSTFQPREKKIPERVLVPRSTAIQNSSYDRQKRMRIVPLYHSAEPQYMVPNRRRSVTREIVPVATVVNSNDRRQTIRVRSLSPL